MTETSQVVFLIAAVAVVLLQLIQLFRKPRFETPADLGARLTLLEQNMQALGPTIARSEGSMARTEQQIRTSTEAIGASLESSRRMMDEQLDKTVEESRQGRLELMSSFTSLEGKLEQRLNAIDSSVTKRLSDFQESTSKNMEANRQSLDARLAQTIEESRNGRGELTTAFQTLETKLEQRIAGFDTSMTGRFQSLQEVLVSRLDETGKAQLDFFTQGQAESAQARKELIDTLSTFRDGLTTTLHALSAETQKSRESLAESAGGFRNQIQERFEALTNATNATLGALKADVTAQLGVMSAAMQAQLEGNGNQIRSQFATLQESVAHQLSTMSTGSHQNAEQLRNALNERLAAIQADNTAKLEEMRRTVDEKLHATLEQRLGDSFKIVSERLEQVHAGLGEMKNLAGSVGDLKRVMTNVRSRGTWGEVQLGAIIESLLTAEQFARNVKTVPGSNDLVEFAIRMPGKADDEPVWLPIDSKYPVEHYQRLVEAHDTMDKTVVQQAVSAFETSIRGEARKIAAKYLSPPHTTDFAILFLPTEGLFAEVARIPGMVEALQNDFRVVVAGPTTLAAMLNSLRLGFRTLAIEKRSSEVWNILGTVKTEFHKFGYIVDSTKKSIDAAANKFKDIGVRTRAIQRSLREVQDLPITGDAVTAMAAAVLGSDDEDGDV